MKRVVITINRQYGSGGKTIENSFHRKAKNLHQIRISLTTKLRSLKNTQQKVLAY